MGDRYQDLLTTWRRLLAQNFTTWPETPTPAVRTAMPGARIRPAALLSYVAGIQPAAPGFAKVRIAPHLGSLKRVDASMAHPKGVIRTRYTVAGGTTIAAVDLPAGLSGELVAGDQHWPLRPGANRVTIAR